MVAMAIYSVTMVLWKETAFPLRRAMERRWKRNVVSRVSSISIIIIIIKDMYIAQVRKGHNMLAKMAVWLRNCRVSIAIYVTSCHYSQVD